MIETIQIQNFQSHKETLLELVSGVNVIAGSSDSGKSAIIRSILWAARNVPSAFEFHSKFADKDELTSVGIGLDGEEYVLRERSVKENKYECSSCESMEAFGTGVPPEVVSLLNLSEYGIQSQHDGYFLLQSTSGEVARTLNKIAGLDVIDEVSKKINSLVNKAKDGIENADEQIGKLKEELKEFDFLPDLERDIGRFEKLLKGREQRRQERMGLYDIVKAFIKLEEEIQQWNEWLEVEQDAKLVINEAREIENLLREKTGIESLLNDISKVDLDIIYYQEDADNHGKVLKMIEDCREIFWIRDEYTKLK